MSGAPVAMRVPSRPYPSEWWLTDRRRAKLRKWRFSSTCPLPVDYLPPFHVPLCEVFELYDATEELLESDTFQLYADNDDTTKPKGSPAIPKPAHSEHYRRFLTLEPPGNTEDAAGRDHDARARRQALAEGRMGRTSGDSMAWRKPSAGLRRAAKIEPPGRLSRSKDKFSHQQRFVAGVKRQGLVTTTKGPATNRAAALRLDAVQCDDEAQWLQQCCSTSSAKLTALCMMGKRTPGYQNAACTNMPGIACTDSNDNTDHSGYVRKPKPRKSFLPPIVGQFTTARKPQKKRAGPTNNQGSGASVHKQNTVQLTSHSEGYPGRAEAGADGRLRKLLKSIEDRVPRSRVLRKTRECTAMPTLAPVHDLPQGVAQERFARPRVPHRIPAVMLAWLLIDPPYCGASHGKLPPVAGARSHALLTLSAFYGKRARLPRPVPCLGAGDFQRDFFANDMTEAWRTKQDERIQDLGKQVQDDIYRSYESALSDFHAAKEQLVKGLARKARRQFRRAQQADGDTMSRYRKKPLGEKARAGRARVQTPVLASHGQREEFVRTLHRDHAELVDSLRRGMRKEAEREWQRYINEFRKDAEPERDANKHAQRRRRRRAKFDVDIEHAVDLLLAVLAKTVTNLEGEVLQAAQAHHQRLHVPAWAAARLGCTAKCASSQSDDDEKENVRPKRP
eukprot:scpid44280/ scgid19342/ 